MNNDNEENNKEANQSLISNELSALTDYYLPDGILIKGIETLAQMKDKVLELDNALLELAKTSGFSASELKNVTEEAFRLGDAAGKTGTEVLSYISSAAETGYNMKESLTLTEEALKLANISSSIGSADTAITYMNTILDAFGKNTDFASTVNNALTGISQTETVDFDTLAEGAIKLSQAAGEAGMSFEEMLGLLTGAYGILEDMDQAADGETVIFSRLKETYGNARNIYDILEELNHLWSAMDTPSKESFAASTAGEEQKNVFAALMDNWKGVETAVFSASNSFGAADAANADYLDSINGKTAEFHNQVEQLSASILDSGLLKFFLNLGTDATASIDSMINKFNSLTALGTLAGGFLGAKNLGRADTNSRPSLNMPSLMRFPWIQGFCMGSRAIHG